MFYQLPVDAVTKVAPRHAVVEASSLDMRPGEWPTMLVLIGPEKTDKSAEGWIFIRSEMIPAGEEFGGYVYRSRDGRCRLDIFND